MPILRAQILQRPSQGERPRAHLIGACGAGMKALAEILLDVGWELSGSDLSSDSSAWKSLISLGVHLVPEHQASSISAELDIVFFSAAIPNSNPERTQASALGIPQLSYVDSISRIANSMSCVAVAGTHGKSSTTAWIAALLEQIGHSPTFICGAERTSDHRNGKLGKGNLAVVEACEYRNHFHALNPEAICLLGIEPDHFDCFSHFDLMIEAYAKFLDLLPSHGKIVYNKDCSVSSELILNRDAKTISFSLRDSYADWYCQREGRQIHFFSKGIARNSYEFPLVGKHQLINLTAAMATIEALDGDLSHPGITERILSPPQLKRRFEIIESGPFGTVINDYAHHPTEIRMTLEATRKQYPNSRIRCCFQPHQLSRTQTLHMDFVEALALADFVFILPVFAAREAQSVEFVNESQKLVEDLNHRGKSAMFIPSLDQVWRTLETDASNQDILLTLGAGDITRIHNERI
ncbi:Mur ligase family protein [Planctomicrobium sp.]|nr:Mur ligase family protein [Planctomicrobium sp.]MDB4439787.1 Mur ligase family protein [Planctomicrobium sp.]MDB4743134.1 Mur ligase family protein [Planctomicrobium sp.]